MARFKAKDIDNYGGNGGSGYFSLKNDKDVAHVRFMYDSAEDIEGYAVHQVEINGRKRWVNCLRDYTDPISKCPFCEAGHFQQVKLFIPLYDEDEQRTKVWERGKKFLQKVTSVCTRYSRGGVASHQFEIERNGKAGSMETSYEIYEVGSDNTTLEDLPEMPKIIGGLVLDKSADEMRTYLDTGAFPEDGEQVTRRASRDDDYDDEPRRRQPTRRRPSDATDTF